MSLVKRKTRPGCPFHTGMWTKWWSEMADSRARAESRRTGIDVFRTMIEIRTPTPDDRGR